MNYIEVCIEQVPYFPDVHDTSVASWASTKAPWQFYYEDPKQILLFFI